MSLTRMMLSFHLACLVSAGVQQHVAFDEAHASSTHSVGSLAGSPTFGAEHALSSGSGYWCSSGTHAAGQSVLWTGVLNSRRVATGVKVDWAYSPGEVKVLISSDGANFEEAKCWQASTRPEVAFEETFMFSAPTNVKAVTIAMRSPQSWGYFGINTVALIGEPGPLMLVSGITSSFGELCLTTSSPGANLESCLEAIAAGDGREVVEFDQDGQIVSMADGSCLTLVDGDTTGGGTFAMDVCSASPSSGDGRSVFAIAPSGQLKMPRIGNYCVTLRGASASEVDVAKQADIEATSSDDQHDVSKIVDGDSQSFWSSAVNPSSPVDLQLRFSAPMKIRYVEIDWEHPAQAFELQVPSKTGWTTFFKSSGNNAPTTKYLGLAASASALRLRMTKPHPTLGNSGGHAVYAIRSIRVLGSSSELVVQDCLEAEDNTDARDKFFMVAVQEFDPRLALTARQSAALLGAAQEHLGILLADLYVAMPTLESCGFKASFAKHVATRNTAATSLGEFVHDQDASSVAVAAIAPSIGYDLSSTAALISNAREALARIPR
jgi:hypothetical protein